MKKFTMMIATGLLAGATLSACAVTTAGVNKHDERSFARSLNDVSAARAIKARMLRSEGFQLKGVDVEVAEGIVLLSGHALRPEDRIEAERIAWSAPRIVQVGNEVRLSGGQGQISNAKDGILNNSVRTRLITNSAVKARNYNIEVHDGTVYLMGVARTAEELATAAHIASTTKGTREVVSYVRIANDQSASLATGPGHNGVPSMGLSPNSIPYAPAAQPLPYTPPSAAQIAPHSLPPQALPPANPQASLGVPNDQYGPIPNDEPYYMDPYTGERIQIPDGVTPIPLGKDYVLTAPGTESSPTMRDPATGQDIPVRWENDGWVRVFK